MGNLRPPTTIPTPSLHDALPIFDTVLDLLDSSAGAADDRRLEEVRREREAAANAYFERIARSEEHTSELQSRENLVCRLLLEQKRIPRLQRRHSQDEHRSERMDT